MCIHNTLIIFKSSPSMLFLISRIQNATIMMVWQDLELVQTEEHVHITTKFAILTVVVQVHNILLSNKTTIFQRVCLPCIALLIFVLYYFQGVTAVMECLTQELIQQKAHVQMPTTFVTTLDHVEVDIFLRIKIEVFLNFIIYLPGFHF